MIVILQNMPHVIRHMLIDQNDSNIIPGSERLEGILNGFGFCFGFNSEKVDRVGGTVTYSCEEKSGDGVLGE